MTTEQLNTHPLGGSTWVINRAGMKPVTWKVPTLTCNQAATDSRECTEHTTHVDTQTHD